MIQKNLILVVTLLSLQFFQSSSLAASGLIGSAAPYFKVQSGDEKELNLDMIKGKVIVIFYETKDIVENNKRIKDGSPKSPCHLREPPDISFENRPILDSNPSRRRHTLVASSVLVDVCSSYSVVLVWGESLLKTG